MSIGAGTSFASAMALRIKRGPRPDPLDDPNAETPGQWQKREAKDSSRRKKPAAKKTARKTRKTARARALRMDDAHGVSHGIPKPPIKQFIESPNHSSRNGTVIDMVVLHFTDGPSARSAINHFLEQSSQVSAHYIIDRNGDIYQMVRDSDKAWHAKGANPRSIGIEHVALSDQHMSDDQETSSVALIKWLLATYSIPTRNILGHRFAPSNIGTTNCPSHLFGEATRAAIDTWVASHFS